jgi:flagellar motor switch protein FliN/FliY
MAAQKETAEQITKWLAEEWGKAFVGVIESMADQRPTTSCDGVARSYDAAGGSAEGSLGFEQEFSLGPQCLMLLSVPELVWREAGTRVLKAAGIEEVGREDALSTFHEVLSQTLSGVAQAMSSRLGREVTCAARSDKDKLPGDVMGLSLSINIPDAEIGDYPVFISPASELVEQLREAEASPVANPSLQEPAERPSPASSSISKTFDLLLGVSLPVSVSFGKTSMMVKEVLKLTTGSIVELNRAVTEPVDIIVNNCIIARGEVVVVAGNYGVRVKEIVSREQRYQTGFRPPLAPVHAIE